MKIRPSHRALKATYALLALIGSAAVVSAQSFTASQLNILARESHSLSARDFGSFAAHGTLSSFSFNSPAVKGNADEFKSLAVRAQSIAPTGCLTVDYPQKSVVSLPPTTVPELPAYAALLGLATFAYTVMRPRNRVGFSLME
jgi:hypothetical protein